MKKTLALVLAVLMVLALAACAKTPASSTAPASSAAPAESKDTESKEETKITYPLKDGGELSLAWVENAAVTAGGNKWQDTPFIKGLEENTGIKLKIVHPQDFSVYFAGQDYADMIYYLWDTYVGGAAKAISDNIIIPIEKYLEKDAPDYKAFIESNNDWNKMATTSDGHKYAFNFVRTEEVLRINAGLIIRDDWMKDLGLELPETPEELKNVLIAFRDKKGATAPISLMYGTMQQAFAQWGTVTGAFGLPSYFGYVENGTVKYGAYEDNYKDYLAYMNDLYKEGLIDKNFMTLDVTTVTANLINGVSGLVAGAGGGGIGNWMSAAEKVDPKFSLTGVSPLVAKKGDRAIGGHYDNPIVRGTGVAISSSCKNVELACNFLNYGYTDAGHDYWNFGTEGVSYTIVKDNPYYTHAFTDKVMKAEGLSVQQGMAQYCRAWDGGPFGQDPEYIYQFFARQQQKDALNNWVKTDVAKYKLPPITVSQERADEYASLTSEVNTYISEQSAKFITGELSLDKFDEYKKTLKDMGVEKINEYMQEAYDEYQSR